MITTETTSISTTPTRRAAVTGLAAVGFVALIALGMALAIYSARFVPNAVNGIGSAAVYLGSIFTPSSPDTSLAVVPTATSTTLVVTATSTPATTTPITTTPAKKPVAPSAGTPSSGVYQIGGSTGGTLYGFPDLTISIDSVGYLTTANADSFVAAGTVPHGFRPAVRFTVRNSGTNVASAWRFFATIPAQNSYVYQSNLQQALNPGDSIQFTMGFDQANSGTNQQVSITVNPGQGVTESNTTNDTATASLTILGS